MIHCRKEIELSRRGFPWLYESIALSFRSLLTLIHIRMQSFNEMLYELFDYRCEISRFRTHTPIRGERDRAYDLTQLGTSILRINTLNSILNKHEIFNTMPNDLFLIILRILSSFHVCACRMNVIQFLRKLMLVIVRCSGISNTTLLLNYLSISKRFEDGHVFGGRLQ